MRVAIVNLTGSGISGGYKRYLQNLLPRLAENECIDELLCASPGTFKIETWVPSHPKLHFVECRPFRFLHHRPDPELNKALLSFNPDVIFTPVPRYIRFGKVPLVVMIQNMAPLVPGAWTGLKECAGLAAQWLETRIAVRKAATTITMSDFACRFLLNNWKIPKDRIRLIYFGNSIPAENPSRPAAIPLDWKNFIFTAGSIEQYRGLEDVILAVRHARFNANRPLRVVIGGSARKDMLRYAARLRKMADNAGISGDLCWAGQLTPEEMTWCYNNCSAFAMTSRVESFAVVVLEALAHGCQCVSADNPPLPEAFRDSAVYYPPGDAEALARKVLEVLDRSEAQSQAFREKVKQRNQAFSWHSTAVLTIQTLLAAAGKK